MSRVHLFDIPFDPIRIGDVAGRIQTLLADGKQHVITTPNPEILLESLENLRLRDFLQSSDLSIADGIGVLWATVFEKARKKGSNTLLFLRSLCWIVFSPGKIRTVLPERVTGVDSMEEVCSAAKDGGKGVFLLGGADGVAEAAGEVLKKKIPGLNVAGSYSGKPFSADDEEMRRHITESGAEILFVAFGCPKQERWITENLPKLPNVKIAMGVGGSFDFIAGMIKRAPQWMKFLGIEWLYRLLQEPRKRLPRIWRAVVVFPWKVFFGSSSNNG